MKSKMKRWEYELFEILQVSPCTGLLAVYAVEDGEDSKTYKLESYPVHFIAVARVTTRFCEVPDHPDSEGELGRKYQDDDVRNEVVGLDLSHGSFEACNESANFAGYCMEGDDITEATDYLVRSKYPLSATA